MTIFHSIYFAYYFDYGSYSLLGCKLQDVGVFKNVLFTTISVASKSVPDIWKTLGQYWLSESMNEVISSPQEEGQGKIPEEMMSEQMGFEG